MLKDLQHAIRGLPKRPIMTLVIVATLGIGIAATTTVYSMVAPFLFRQLDYAQPQELVHLYHVDPSEGATARFSIPQYKDWKSYSAAYSDLSLYNYGPSNITFAAGSSPEQIMTGRVSPNLFPMLGAVPQIGNLFPPDSDLPGQGTVMLGYAMWQNRFQGDPEVLGKTLWVDGEAHEISGVMPPNFNFPFGEIEMWVPLLSCGCSAAEDRGATTYLMVGRLAEGRGLADAQDDAIRLHTQLSEAYPEEDGYFTGINIVPLKQGLIFNYQLISLLMLLMLGLVGLMLLIVVANVANILLARAVARVQEVAVRRAMGCSRWHVVRLFLFESLTLASLGAVLGVFLAGRAIELLSATIPESLFRVGVYQIDTAALAVTIGASLVAAIAFSVAPALSSTRLHLVGALKEGGAKALGGLRGARLRGGLAGAQIFIAVVLVLSATFLLGSLDDMKTRDYGYDLDEVLTLRVKLASEEYPDREAVLGYHDTVAQRLEAVPGVDSASLIYPLPLDHSYITARLAIPGWEPANPNDKVFANRLIVSGDFFATSGVSVLEGRGIHDSDTSESEQVVVVNKTFADRFYPQDSAVGQEIEILRRSGEAKPVRIVGVVDDIVHRVQWQEGDTIWPQIYQPFHQAPVRMAYLMVRSERPEATIASVRATLQEYDANVPVDLPRTMREVSQASYEPILMMSNTLTGFAMVAIFLAAIGTYGVLAYTLTQRLREIGIRMAIGASPSEIRRSVLAQGLRIGLFGGLPALLAVVVTLQFLSGPLSGFGDLGVGAALGVVLLFAVLVLLSSIGPARRAGKLDPVHLLAEE